MIRRRTLVRAAALLLAGPALAQDRPPTLPLRDVDVSYVIPTQDGALRQRLRFSSARQTLRLDPPGGGLYIVIDFRAGRMFAVRDGDRSVIEMAAPRAWMPGLGQARYARRNDVTVAGVSCTEWQTIDSEGREVRICLDRDGVMIRVSTLTPGGETVLALAENLRREPQDPSVFAVPAGYRRLSPPPLAGAR